MDRIYQQFMEEKLNQFGKLVGVSFHYPENYNFGFDVLDVLAERYPHQDALVWLSREKEKKVYSFLDMKEKSNQTANFLRRHGIKKGDVVMLVVKRHLQFWPLMIALHKIGAIVVPATFLLTEKDLVYRFNKAKVKAVVCTSDGEIADTVDASLQDSPTLELRFLLGGKEKEGWIDFDTGVEQESTDFPRPTGADMPLADETMLMYFTSGTTSNPRLAMHSHTYSIGHIITGVHWHNAERGGLHFTISDTGWGKAVWGKLYGQWFAECAVLAYDFDKFDPKDILSVIADNKVTTFCAPPTMYRFIIQENMAAYDLSSLKYLTTAGEALNPEVFNRILQATGIRIMEGFGQTETTLSIANLRGSQSVSMGSMGKPSPQYKLTLLDKDDNMVDPGVIGEICIDTREGHPIGMFTGYYDDEELTEKVWHDGFYHTGDVAWRDENGNFWFVGRSDDLIKSSGYRISPFEVESVLMEHAAVMECAVTGIPDAVRGQIIKASIILAPGYSATDALSAEIQAYVKKQTAPYKYPRVIEFVEDLPKTISGKIRRVEIRERTARLTVLDAASACSFSVLEPAHFSSAVSLLQLFKDTVGEAALSKKQLDSIEEALAADRIAFYLAVEDGEAVGICSVSFSFSTYAGGTVGIFDDLYILPSHRGRGISRGLANCAFEDMEKRGIPLLMVSTESERDRFNALGFSSKVGSLLAWKLNA